jgi:hypothetical protein
MTTAGSRARRTPPPRRPRRPLGRVADVRLSTGSGRAGSARDGRPPPRPGTGADVGPTRARSPSPIHDVEPATVSRLLRADPRLARRPRRRARDAARHPGARSAPGSSSGALSSRPGCSTAATAAIAIAQPGPAPPPVCAGPAPLRTAAHRLAGRHAPPSFPGLDARRDAGVGRGGGARSARAGLEPRGFVAPRLRLHAGAALRARRVVRVVGDAAAACGDRTTRRRSPRTACLGTSSRAKLALSPRCSSPAGARTAGRVLRSTCTPPTSSTRGTCWRSSPCCSAPAAAGRVTYDELRLTWRRPILPPASGEPGVAAALVKLLRPHSRSPVDAERCCRHGAGAGTSPRRRCWSSRPAGHRSQARVLGLGRRRGDRRGARARRRRPSNGSRSRASTPPATPGESEPAVALRRAWRRSRRIASSSFSHPEGDRDYREDERPRGRRAALRRAGRRTR